MAVDAEVLSRQITMAMTKRLLSRESFSVEMPAGTGKTHSLVSVSVALEQQGYSVLVLTHTHAGVHAIRQRIYHHQHESRIQVRTIDSWSYELLRAFPKMSKILVDDLPNWKRSKEYHAGTLNLLGSRFVRDMITEDYDFVLIDEYQDCSPAQHRIFEELQRLIPVGVFGDPLQYLFRFREHQDGEQPLHWSTNIEARFPRLEVHPHPWRWVHENIELGSWSLDIREHLKNGNPVNIGESPVAHLTVGWNDAESFRTLEAFLNEHDRSSETTVVLHTDPKFCWHCANEMNTSFALADPIYAPFVEEFAYRFVQKEGYELFSAVKDFASMCARHVDCLFPVTLTLQLINKIDSQLSDDSNDNALKYARAVIETGSFQSIIELLSWIASEPRVTVYRREAFAEMMESLRMASQGELTSILEYLESIRDSKSRYGRSLSRTTISRPLLTKGLEFDHSVIISPSEWSREELYVSLTRASKSVTVVSRTPLLVPKH